MHCTSSYDTENLLLNLECNQQPNICLDVTSQTETVFFYCIIKVKAERTFCVSVICSEINVRRIFACLVA